MSPSSSASAAPRRGDVVDVAVVGAGIAGLSLAWALTERRVRTVVLDAGAVGARGASSLPAALLNPYRGRSARAHDDDLAGLAAFWRRDRALRAAGLEPGSHRTGVLRVADTEKLAARWHDRLAEDAATRWFESDALPAPYAAPHGAFLALEGGWLEPDALLAALAKSVRDRGGEIREGIRAEGIEDAPTGEPRALGTDAGPLRARRVVLCVGAERTPGLPLPELARIAGDVIGVRAREHFAWPVAGGVYGAWRAPAGIDATGDDAGTAYIGGHHRDPDAPLDPDALDALRRRFARRVPALADAARVSHWSGVRAKRDGHRPWAARLEPGVWFFGALAGRGFLCAADEAERLAERLTTSLGES